MTMNRRSMLALLSALTVSAALVGCGGAKTIDINDAADKLKAAVAFEGELKKAKNAEAYIDMEDGVTAVLYTTDGAECLAVFDAGSQAAAQKTVDHVKQYLDEKKDEAEKYHPEQVKLVTDALVKQSGQYVFLVVAGDTAAAESTISSLLH